MPAKRPRYGGYRWSDLVTAGRLLGLRCGLCRRLAYYDPADLMAIYGDGDAETPPFDCSHCGTVDFVTVFFHDVAPGDYGSLPIRRPERVERIVWRVAKLGEPPT